MDIKILKLYKQHYLDSYTDPLPADYSCWGYYDGMSLEKMTDNYTSNLVLDESRARIPQQWFETAISTQNLKGGYSQQNVAIFRSFRDPNKDSQKLVDLFEREKSVMPFLGVAFVQMKNSRDYDNLRREIEDKEDWTWDQKPERVDESLTRSICYTSFDNDDLVVLIHGNDLIALEDRIHTIEAIPKIRYLHSILGIQEDYLSVISECAMDMQDRQDSSMESIIAQCEYREASLAGMTRQVQIHIREEVHRLRIRMVTSGEKELLKKEAHFLKRQNELFHFMGFSEDSDKKCSPRYAMVNGHEDAVFELGPTNVYTMLAMHVKNGFSTHQNPGYEKRRYASNGEELVDEEPCLYNMETVYTLKPKPLAKLLEDSKDAEFGDNIQKKSRWCREKLKYYQYKMTELRKQNSSPDKREDQALYAAYQAIIQTLNMLSQYEELKIANDIFYLIAPSFKMFCKKFDRAVGLFEEEKEAYRAIYAQVARKVADKMLLDEASVLSCTESLRKENEEILENDIDNVYSEVKRAVNDYLEAVNAVIYHTIHTDQVFLMVPGYCGSSYTIPIKLTMLFQWLAQEILGMLQKDRQYGCILEPSMEARPITSKITFGYEEYEREVKDYLVRIRFSQRSLYMPVSLMVIISHEMGHYIGGNLRNREHRTEQIVKAVSHQLLWKLLLPNEVLGRADNSITGVDTATYKTIAQILYDYIYQDLDKWIIQRGEHRNYGDELILELQKCVSLLLAKLVRAELNKDLMKALLSAKVLDEDGYTGYTEKQLLGLTDIVNMISFNAQWLIGTDEMRTFIIDEVQTYREIFSDLIPRLVLGCSYNDLKKSEHISEGVDNANIISSSMVDRNLVASMLEQNRSTASAKDLTVGKELNPQEQDISEILTGLRYEYVDRCRIRIENWFREDEARQTKRESVQNIYNLLKNREACADEIYGQIIECIWKLKNATYADPN